MAADQQDAATARNPRAVARQAILEHAAQQDELELATLLGILGTRAVRTVLEIGTASGGTTWAWCQLPEVTKVVTVDLRVPPVDTSRPPWSQLPVTWIQGNSGDIDTRREVYQAMAGVSADMLYIDGDHTGRHPKLDWLLYHGLVRSGGLVVFHDTQGFPGRTDYTVGRWWKEIRRTGDSLELVSRPGGPCGTGILWAT